jgi:PhnB protein
MKEVNAYLNFPGNCREAMQFYQKSLGAELQLVTFGEMPGNPPEVKDRIMHARLAKGSTLLMASDLMPGMPHQTGTNFSIAVHCENVSEIEKCFHALGENGKVTMPLQATPWAQRFGMLTDQFGVHWMLNLDQTAQP